MGERGRLLAMLVYFAHPCQQMAAKYFFSFAVPGFIGSTMTQIPSINCCPLLLFTISVHCGLLLRQIKYVRPCLSSPVSPPPLSVCYHN